VALPAEILKKVKLLEISTRKLVNSTFAGQYHSAFKGQGMTFAEFREYVPGDDVRTISWPVTARTGKTFIKKFDEERELIILLAVDISGSTNFGTGPYIKGEVITHLSAILGFAAAKNNDHVGLLLFTDQVEHYVPPKKGRGHIQRILRDLYYYQPKSQGTKISVGIDYLQGILKKKAAVFIFSDFMDPSFSQSLRMLARKHDTVACVVEDPAERELPNAGLVDFHDAESGEVLTVDTSSTTFRRHYQDVRKKALAEREKELRKAQVDSIQIECGENFTDPLVAYFRRRSHGRR
jgi:uncharacterized protein (DUF58 family)